MGTTSSSPEDEACCLRPKGDKKVISSDKPPTKPGTACLDEACCLRPKGDKQVTSPDKPLASAPINPGTACCAQLKSTSATATAAVSSVVAAAAPSEHAEYFKLLTGGQAPDAESSQLSLIVGDQASSVMGMINSFSEGSPEEFSGVLKELTGGAANLLEAVAPIALIAAPVLAFAGIILGQFSAYMDIYPASQGLLDKISRVKAIVVRSATSKSLNENFSMLIGDACIALTDATKLVKKAMSEQNGSVWDNIVSFIFAGSTLKKLAAARDKLQECVATLGIAAAVEAVIGIEKVQTCVALLDEKVARVESSLGRITLGATGSGGQTVSAPAGRALTRLLVKLNILHHAQIGGGNGLDAEKLPLVDLSLWTTVDAGSVRRLSSGEAATFALLSKPMSLGIRLLSSPAGMGRPWLLGAILSCHAAAMLARDPQPDITMVPSENRGIIKGNKLANNFERIIRIDLRRLAQKILKYGDTWTASKCTVGDAVATSMARLLRVDIPVVASDLFFGDCPAPTLWILDGFDMLPGFADASCDQLLDLTEDVKAALLEAHSRRLTAPCEAASEQQFRARLAAEVPPERRIQAVLRVLLTQPAVIVTARPRCEPLLGGLTFVNTAAPLEPGIMDPTCPPAEVHRYLRLGKLATVSVELFLQASLEKEALVVFKKRLEDSSALLEAMRSPQILQMFVAAFQASRLKTVKGLPDDAIRAEMGSRAPVVGMFLRSELLLAQRVWDKYSEIHDKALNEKVRDTHSVHTTLDDRDSQWMRLRALLSEAALTACCSENNDTFVPWPGTEEDLELLTLSEIVSVNHCDAIEFSHRSIQDYFAAVGVVQRLRGYSPCVVSPCNHASACMAEQNERPPTLFDWWHTMSDSIPRDTFMAVLLSNVPSEIKTWALRYCCQMDSKKDLAFYECTQHASAYTRAASCMSQQVIRVLAIPSNSHLRSLALGLCEPESNTSVLVLEALAAGSPVNRYCDFLAGCIQYYPPNGSLIPYHEIIDGAVAAFWESPSPESAQLLAGKFWRVAYAVNCAQARRAIQEIQDAIGPYKSSDDSVCVRASAAACVLGLIASFKSTPELIAAHEVLEAASRSTNVRLVEQSAIARAHLDPCPQSNTASAIPSGEKRVQRLLRIVQANSCDVTETAALEQAVTELAEHHRNSNDVNGALKSSVAQTFKTFGPTPFLAAILKGFGNALVSTDVACMIFQCPWLSSTDSIRLAIRLWAPAETSDKPFIAERYTPLHVAAKFNRLDFIDAFCCTQDSDVIKAALEKVNAAGETPLAVAEGDEAISSLIQFGASPLCRRTRDGQTPLHAVQSDSVLMKRLLDDAGLDPNVPTRAGLTPLHVAAKNARPNIVRVLLRDRRVDRNPNDNIGRAPLHFAAMHGHAEIVKILLADPLVDPNDVDENLCVPFHEAAKNGQAHIVALLLSDVRVKINAKNSDGHTALSLARRALDVECNLDTRKALEATIALLIANSRVVQ